MPIRFKYDPEGNVLYEVGSGELSFQDFKEFRKKMMSLSLKPGFKGLADYTKAKVNLTSEEMWKMKVFSDKIAEQLGGVKLLLAIVAADDLGFGMARMFSMTSELESLEVVVFKTRAEACAWLDIEEPEGDIV